ncbi:MAG: hypothetical protein ACYDG3_07260 [Bacillati bacterium]
MSFRSNLKNYDNEIEQFLAWIQPYIEAHSVSVGDDNFFLVGYTRYEEDADPTLIYFGAYDMQGKQKHVYQGRYRVYTIDETLQDGPRVQDDPASVPVTVT